MKQAEYLRQLRKLESDNLKLDAQLKLTNKKLKQSEFDLGESEDRQKILLATQDDLPTGTLVKAPKASSSNATAIVCWTDWHVEETILSGAVNGLNRFNLKVADARIKKTVENTIRCIEVAKKLSKIDDLVIWLGGDFITGYIHEELQESNSLSPVEAIEWAQERLFLGIRSLSQALKPSSIRVVGNVGNHSRTTQKMRVSTTTQNSYEWLMYNNLSKFCQLDGLVSDWKLPEGYLSYLEIQGHNVRFHHGDAIKYGGGIGGINIPVNKAISQWNKAKPAVLDIFGHWHQWIDQWNWNSVGCLIGYGPFSLKIKADYQPPTQTVIVMDRNYGKVLALPVFCESISKT